MITIKRKLYKRGSSFETTIPMPLLFSLDISAKHNVLFTFDSKKNKWYLDFEPSSDPANKSMARHRRKDDG
jgi:hypothetical protein